VRRPGLVATVPKEPYVVASPAVSSTVLLAENSLVVRPPVPEELRAGGWDVREKPGATHEIHVQDRRRVVERDCKREEVEVLACFNGGAADDAEVEAAASRASRNSVAASSRFETLRTMSAPGTR
jgi:hypothetical protein